MAVLGHAGGYAREGGGRRFGSGKVTLMLYGLPMGQARREFLIFPVNIDGALKTELSIDISKHLLWKTLNTSMKKKN